MTARNIFCFCLKNIEDYNYGRFLNGEMELQLALVKESKDFFGLLLKIIVPCDLYRRMHVKMPGMRVLFHIIPYMIILLMVYKLMLHFQCLVDRLLLNYLRDLDNLAKFIDHPDDFKLFFFSSRICCRLGNVHVLIEMSFYQTFHLGFFFSSFSFYAWSIKKKRVNVSMKI
jgi:hypothetical protein